MAMETSNHVETKKITTKKRFFGAVLGIALVKDNPVDDQRTGYLSFRDPTRSYLL